MRTIYTAIDLIKRQRDNLKKIIDAECPYEAFQLLALHIDFLGKLLHRLKPKVSAAWEKDKPDASTCFGNVVKLPSMQKYDKNILRDNLRNGMIHNEVPKAHLKLTHTATQELDRDDITININDIYGDYSSACDEIIERLEKYEKAHPDSLMENKKFPRIVVKQTDARVRPLELSGKTEDVPKGNPFVAVDDVSASFASDFGTAVTSAADLDFGSTELRLRNSSSERS